MEDRNKMEDRNENIFQICPFVARFFPAKITTFTTVYHCIIIGCRNHYTSNPTVLCRNAARITDNLKGL